MASVKTYLVPVDFSRTSGKALTYAVKLARETGAQLLLVHVITDSPLYVPVNLRAKFYEDLENEARRKIKSLMKAKTRRDMKYRSLILKNDNPARSVAEQARKSRVSMIVMGSQGRTGVDRLMLGSVAETTVRYARCPILIVKR